ncbi:MAG TPA: hypothetical protein DCE26_00990 [Dehalococcoidia bacterium]|nr:hypothetical protein [Dehalococcoidia bacterium]
MFENVAEHIDEAVRLAERCPEKYQIPCFQALIGVLAQSDASPVSLSPGNSHAANGNGDKPTAGLENDISGGVLSRPAPSTDRALVFLEQHQIPSGSLSRVYHLDGNSYRIIVKDLREKTNSKKQVKLALLLGVGGLLLGEQPVFSKERLIETCREYGAYDAPNFASHMKKQRDLFISQGNEWSLTVPAQQRAADAIKDLAA